MKLYTLHVLSFTVQYYVIDNQSADHRVTTQHRVRTFVEKIREAHRESAVIIIYYNYRNVEETKLTSFIYKISSIFLKCSVPFW